jgi:hypothetical protein
MTSDSLCQVVVEDKIGARPPRKSEAPVGNSKRRCRKTSRQRQRRLEIEIKSVIFYRRLLVAEFIFSDLTELLTFLTFVETSARNFEYEQRLIPAVNFN